MHTAAGSLYFVTTLRHFADRDAGLRYVNVTNVEAACCASVAYLPA